MQPKFKVALIPDESNNVGYQEIGVEDDLVEGEEEEEEDDDDDEEEVVDVPR